jgi:tetratricopeptide (TPR) repeat protein
LKAQEELYNQNYSEAARLYNNIADKRVDKDLKIKVYYQLGDLYENHLNDYEKAISSYQEIMNFDAEIVWQVKSFERIANIYFVNLKNYQKAYEIYEKLSLFMPLLEKNDLYRYRMAQCFLKQNEYEKAQAILSEIASNNINSFYDQANFDLGLIFYYKKMWKEAIEQWKSFLKIANNENKIVEAKFLMANSYEMLEELKKAYSLYYSILPTYSNAEVIKGRLRSIYERRKARKR